MNEEKITTSDNKKLSPEEIKRVKGLGCLQDKRYDNMITSLIFGSSQEMDILPQMNTVPLQTLQINSEMVRSL